MKYDPTHSSVSTHIIPAWYDDAKLGIFIHWGLYSIPAFAEPGEDEISLNNLNFAEMPYSEWYYNKLRIKGSSTEKYHNKTYGKDFSYFDFAPQFAESTKGFNAEGWAELFKKSGARYVVMTTKHHDGYLLWPSKYKNARVDGYLSERDLVGEVCAKVRSKGMKMGLYYSGVLDWTYNTTPVNNYINFLENLKQDDDYIKYIENHYYELIERYQPSVLWNDIGYPYGYDLNKLFADYYNSVEDGVINDRWKQSRIPNWLINPALKNPINSILSMLVKLSGTGKPVENGKLPDFHTDFTTPEYASFKTIQHKKFESTRGIGHSFAYNRMEDESHMLSGKELIYMLADVVSKNGNLLINVGPTADGTIPQMQQKPLLETGDWLGIYGDAIYGTRPWTRAEGKTSGGDDVRFTAKGNSLYAIILAPPASPEVMITELQLPADAELLIPGKTVALNWRNERDGICIRLPEDMPSGPAFAVEIRHPRL